MNINNNAGGNHHRPDGLLFNPNRTDAVTGTQSQLPSEEFTS